MAGYRRTKTKVVSETGESSVIIGEEGVKVPSGETKLTVGQVEDLTGVSRTTLRYYDKIGLLCPERTGKGVANDRKLYGVDDLGRLQAIEVFSEYRFSLDEIANILDGDDDELYKAIVSKLEDLKRQEARLRSLILFAQFVAITDTDLIESLACGPGTLDEMADLAREASPYERAMCKLDAYEDDEALFSLEQAADVIRMVAMLDDGRGFAGVDEALTAFFAWWDDFVLPAAELGYLGFWAVFEDQGLIAEYVEKIGVPGDAATLQMLAFFVLMVRFAKASDLLIAEIAQLAESDIVAAMDCASELTRAAGIALLGTEEGEAASSEVLAELSFSILRFLVGILENESLCAYLGLDEGIAVGIEETENALRVIDVMCS